MQYNVCVKFAPTVHRVPYNHDSSDDGMTCSQEPRVYVKNHRAPSTVSTFPCSPAHVKYVSSILDSAVAEANPKTNTLKTDIAWSRVDT